VCVCYCFFFVFYFLLINFLDANERDNREQERECEQLEKFFYSRAPPLPHTVKDTHTQTHTQERVNYLHFCRLAFLRTFSHFSRPKLDVLNNFNHFLHLLTFDFYC